MSHGLYPKESEPDTEPDGIKCPSCGTPLKDNLVIGDRCGVAISYCKKCGFLIDGKGD